MCSCGSRHLIKESSLLEYEVCLWLFSVPGQLLSSHTELLFFRGNFKDQTTTVHHIWRGSLGSSSFKICAVAEADTCVWFIRKQKTWDSLLLYQWMVNSASKVWRVVNSLFSLTKLSLLSLLYYIIIDDHIIFNIIW